MSDLRIQILRIALLLFTIHLSLVASSQNLEACDMPGSKKVQKLWDQALSERKPSVRRELYKEILDAEPDHHGAIFAKAYEQLKKAERDPYSRGIAFGYKPMKAVADLCP